MTNTSFPTGEADPAARRAALAQALDQRAPLDAAVLGALAQQLGTTSALLTAELRAMRREAIRQALGERPALTGAECKALAARFGCDRTLIYHDIRELRGRAPALVRGSDVAAPQRVAIDEADARDIGVLRLLGRLEFVSSAWIARLIFPDLTRRTTVDRLARLHARHLVWRETTTMARLEPAPSGRTPPARQPYVYGLTPEGRDLLERVGAEPDAETLKLLKVRDRRAPAVAQAQLNHDLQASFWCCSMLDHLRRCPLIDAVVCFVEYVSAYQGIQERQRLDALFTVRFNRTAGQTQARPGWDLPWHDGTPGTPHHITLRWALEVDRGTEKLAILLGKGVAYRDLTADGTYQKVFGGPVTPVFLVPPGRRAAQIAREWQSAWPGGAGLISATTTFADPEYGALWGTYRTLAAGQPAPLLAGLASRDQWGQLVSGWTPGTPAAVHG